MIENLSEQQKQLLFDYCLGITTQEESAQAQELIFSNADAAQLYNRLKVFFAPLETLGEETCPEELEEKTIARLKSQERTSRIRLQQLIAAEQIRGFPARLSMLRSAGKVIAAAAVIFFVVGTYLSMAGYMRQQSWQTACSAQLQRIGNGLVSYRNDNNGQMPMVATAAGEPWWKVGYKPDSNENHSNTRHIYLLVRNGYIKNPADFICPGTKMAKTVSAADLEKIQFGQLRDFPGRQFISYSFRICCANAAANKSQAVGNGILISDMNPLFENLPREFEQLRLQVDEKMKMLNSINHAGRGQNVLFEDSRVGFFKTRLIGTDQDDIFTLQNTALYQGNERPTCEADTFVAP